MKRVPIFATLIVIAAITTMIGLGMWQLRRAVWKEAMLARYTAAVGRDPIDAVPETRDLESVAFRRAHVACKVTTGAVQLGGRSEGHESGFRNIVGCRLPDGRVMMADIGWSSISAKPTPPAIGAPLESIGRLIPDDVLAGRVIAGVPDGLPLLVVMERPAPGYLPSVPPDIGDIPNNHRGYAVQWFLFAGVAAIIYVLALRRRALRG
jgi:cytochrome oxidase assembly protein ShyY1